MTAAPSAAAATGSARYEPPSYYVVPTFYDWLMEISADLSSSSVRSSGSIRAEQERAIADLLAVEARLLDQAAHAKDALSKWLALFAEQCAYWVPSSAPANDPRQGVTLEFHDRRRLLDRIARLETGLAFSQLPRSRTSRQYGRCEIWSSPERDNEWRVRCSFHLAESREGHARVLAGWNGFLIRSTDHGLRIVMKQINLIDCDLPQGNNSFFL